MSDNTAVVKVRINASGKRLIGSLELPPGIERVSDVLNSQGPCVLLTSLDAAFKAGKPATHIIFKDSITYVEALEEPKPHTTSPHGGTFMPVVGEIREPQAQQIIAEIFIPIGMTLFEVLNDPRPFISMRNVHFSNFVERYPFLAVCKRQLIVVTA